MATNLPSGSTGAPLPIMQPAPGKGGNLAVGSTSASIALGQNATTGTGLAVQLIATADCFYNLGTTSVTAAAPAAGAMTGSHFLPAAMPTTIFVAPANTHLAAIQSSAAGNLYISILGDGA